jgi:hypothetical protein
MALSRTLSLLYTTILHPVTRTFFRGRDTRCPDARGTLRDITYICPDEVPTPVFNAVYHRATGRRRDAIQFRDITFALVMIVQLGVLIFLLMHASFLLMLPLVLLLAIAILSYAASRLGRSIAFYTTSADRVRDAWLAHTRCPSCIYPGHWPDPHAPRQCTECGALWPPAQPQLPPVLTTTWPQPTHSP